MILRRFVNPVLFQGNLRSRRFFEGWYFKHVSADRKSVYALIPGISLSPRESKSFVQLIDGSSGSTRWFAYPVEAFSSSMDRFEVRIADNRFSLEGVDARLEDEQGVVEAHLEYSGIVPLPFSLRWPGIMGPYTYAPRMECNHGIGSLDHGLTGPLTVNGRRADFTAGRAISRRTGAARSRGLGSGPSPTASLSPAHRSCSPSRAFPIWGGHSPASSPCCSKAAGSTGSRPTPGHASCLPALAGRDLEIVVQGRGHRLLLHAERSSEGVLLAPVDGAMDRRIGESIDARLSVRLEDLGGRVLFEGTGEAAGLEAVGDLSLIGVEAAPPPRA